MPTPRFSCRILAASVAALLAPFSTQAATLYWDGGTADIGATGDAASQGGAGTWNAALLNWDPTPAGSAHVAWPNTTADEAVFGGLSGLVSLGTPITANRLTFDISGYTIDNGGTAANTLTLGGTTPTISVTNGADSATISAIVAGADLTKAGAGTLVLSGTNTYTGPTTISAGTISIGTDLNLGAAPVAATPGSLTLSGGETLTTTNSVTLATNRGIALGAGGGTINVGTGFTTSYGGVIAGANLLTKAGAGTLILTGTNNATATGGTSITEGILQVGANTTLPNGGISINGGTLRVTATNTLASTQVISIGASGGTIDQTTATKLIIPSNFLSGSGTLTRTASANNVLFGTPNVIQITGANTGFTGAVILNGGQNEISLNGLGNGLTAGNTITINNGAELTANNSTLPNALIINAGANIGGDQGTSTFSGAITANGAFNVRLGDFFASVSRNLTISGGITSNSLGAGAITFLNGNTNTVGTGLGQTLFLNGDNSNYSANIAVPAGYTVSFGTVNSRGTGNLTVTSTATALGGIALGYVPATQSDLPTLTTNSTGANGGVFQINTTGFTAALDLGALYGSSTSATGGTNGVWYLGSGATGSYTASTLAASNGTYRLGGGFGTLTIANGVLTGAANVVIGSTTVGTNGTGTVVLAAANDYSGTTTVNAGSTLSISNGSALGSTAAGTTVSAGGSLALSGGITVNEPLTITGTTSTASVTNIVNGLVNVSGTNTYAGQINASTGSNNFRISAAGILNLAGNIVLSGGGTATGLLTSGAGAITQTGSSVISGGGSIISTSTGTVTVLGNNTYIGKTQVQQGSFRTPSLNSVVGGTAASGLGAPPSALAGLIDLGNSTTTGTLVYTGTGETTDRVVNLLGTTGGGVIDQSGTGLLKFTSNLTATGAGIKSLTLQGSTSGTGELSGVIPNNSGTNLTSLVKTGTGIWTLSGLNTYAGATSVNQGTLVINTLTAVSGGASSLGNPTTVAAGTINLGSGTTTSVTGTLQYVGTGSTSDRVINLASNTATGTLDHSGTGTFQVGAVTATGAGIKVLTLTGSTAGLGVIGGIIANNTATNTTGVTKSGSGTWVLAGANSYTGATTIGGGVLRVNGSTNAGSAVAVNGGGYLGGTGTVGGAVTAAVNGGIDLRDGVIGTLSLSSTLALNGSVVAPNSLAFDLGSGTVDTIAATGAVTASTAGGALVTFNQLAGSPLTNGTYTLITSAATSVPTGFSLATTQSGGHTYALSTATTGNILRVTVGTAATGPASAVWGGTASGSWGAAGNWYTDASSGTLTGAIPAVGSNVSFYTTTPAATNLSTTLGADFEINSLNFLSTATSAVTIAGTSNALTIDASTANGNAAGNGISQLAAATHTISSRLGIGGAQTWTVGAGGGLTVSGLVFDTGAGFTLTKAGAGTLTLSGTGNTFTGDINVTAGVLAFAGSNGGNGDPLSLGGGTKTITVTNNAVLRPTSSSNPTSTNTKRFVVGSGGATFDPQTGVTFQFDDATQFSGTGDLTVTSSAATPSGVVQLGAQAYNFTGNVLVNSGTLRIGSSTPLGTTTGRTLNVASGAALDLNSTTTNIPLTITINGSGISNGGALTAATAAGTLTSAVTFGSNSSIGGASALTLSGALGGSFNLTKVGAGTTVLSGTNTYGSGAGTTTTISAGTLLASKTASLPNYSTAGVSAAAGGTLALGVGGAGEFTLADVNNFLGNGTFANGSGIGFDTTNAGGSFTAPSLVSTPAVTSFALTKFGTGTLVIPGPNSFGTASTTILNGTVSVTSGTNDTLGTGALVLGTSGGLPASLDLGTTTQTVTTLTVPSNSATANTIALGAGNSLTATGLVTIGLNSGVNTTTKLNVTGTTSTFSIGTALTATNANVQIGGNITDTFSNVVTLDMSGLGTFFANIGTGVFRVGDLTNATGTATGGSSLTLAATSTVRATTITSDSPDTSVTQNIRLGSVANVLNANTIEIGGSTSGRSNGNLLFDTTTGSLTVRNLAGTGRANLNVAFGGTTTGAAPISVVNLTGHLSDLLLGNLQVGGRTGTSGGNSTGTFSFDTGTLDVTSIVLARRAETASTGTLVGTSTGTVNLGGGTVTVGATGISLASNTSTLTGNPSVATVNVTGSAVTVGATSGTSITLGSSLNTNGPSTATLNITGGSLAVTGNIVKGTTTGTVTSTLTLNGTNALLDLAGKNIGAAGAGAIDNLTFAAGTLQNVNLINGTAGVTKTAGVGADKLALAGTNNYTGPTAVNSGTLEISGSINATSSVVVGSGTTLLLSGGSEKVANVGVSVSSGTVKFADNEAGGFTETLGTLTLSGTSTLDLATGTTNGNTFVFSDLSAGTLAGLNAGTIALNIWNWNPGAGGAIDDGTNNGAIGDLQDRLIFGGATGLNQTGLGQISFFSSTGTGFIGRGGEISFGPNFEIVPVPEPSSTALLGALTIFGLAGYRRRRQSTPRKA